MDRIPAKTRSRLMASVRAKDTKPEVLVRKVLRRLGVKFRIHERGLAGSPDIILPGSLTAIFVHGCFWHRHKGCKKTTTPRTNRDYWLAKFAKNRERDSKAQHTLQMMGWKVLTIWECQTGNAEALERTLLHMLGTLLFRA